MDKKRVQIFSSSAIFFFFFLYACSFWLGQRQERLVQEEISLLHAEVESRFKLLVENKVGILLAGAGVFSGARDLGDAYEDFAGRILTHFDDVLALNFVAPNGKILKVAPIDRNIQALGKWSQHVDMLQETFAKGEKIYITPPFLLYQGKEGIAFYVSTFEGSKFLGWLAIVQSLESFVDKFVVSSFFGSYHLIVKDVESGRSYFASGDVPAEARNVIRTEAKIKGRNISFISWRRSGGQKNIISLPIIVLFALILASVATIMAQTFEQRALAKKNLENIQKMLRATFNSTADNLDLIQEQMELIKKGSGFVPLKKISSHLTYLSALINQLRVIMKISESKKESAPSTTSIFPMVVDLSRSLALRLQLKELLLNYDPLKLMEVEVVAEKWSQYSQVLELVVEYFIETSAPGDEIMIDVSEELSAPAISVRNHKRRHPEALLKGISRPPELVRAEEGLASFAGRLVIESSELVGARILLLSPDLLSFKSS